MLGSEDGVDLVECAQSARGYSAVPVAMHDQHASCIRTAHCSAHMATHNNVPASLAAHGDAGASPTMVVTLCRAGSTATLTMQSPLPIVVDAIVQCMHPTTYPPVSCLAVSCMRPWGVFGPPWPASLAEAVARGNPAAWAELANPACHLTLPSVQVSGLVTCSPVNHGCDVHLARARSVHSVFLPFCAITIVALEHKTRTATFHEPPHKVWDRRDYSN